MVSSSRLTVMICTDAHHSGRYCPKLVAAGATPLVCHSPSALSDGEAAKTIILILAATIDAPYNCFVSAGPQSRLHRCVRRRGRGTIPGGMVLAHAFRGLLLDCSSYARRRAPGRYLVRTCILIMATLTAMPTPTAQLSPPPASNAFARKAGFVDVTFGPRRITFSEPVPPYAPHSYSSSSHSYSSCDAGEQPPAARRPLGVRMREIHAHGPARVRRWVDAGDERPLAPFVDQQVREIIVAIWAPDKTGGWKHYFRAIPISKAYKTDRKDGLAFAVVVEFTQLCPEYLKYRLVALNRISGNAYWAELGHA